MSGGNFTFTWPTGPNEVIVTGVFDNWGKTLPLVKQADGSFELTVPLPSSNDKLFYKYVVDGVWLVSADQKIAKDESGNDNNYLDNDDIIQTSALGSKIPESGGGFVPVLDKSSEVKESPTGNAKATVMPVAETEHHTQNTLGEAGIFIPKDQDQLKAFEQVRDVDPKTLNEPQSEKTKKVKRTEVKAKKRKEGLSSDEVSDYSGEGDQSNVTAPTSSGLDQNDQTLATTAAAVALSKGPDGIENESKHLNPTPTNGAVVDVPVDSKEIEQGSSATPLVGAAVIGSAGAAGVAAAAAHPGSGVNNGAGIVGNKDVQDVPEPTISSEPVVTKQDAHPEPVVEDLNDFEVPKTLDPKVAEPELEESEVAATPIVDVPIKSIDESEPIVENVVPKTVDNVEEKGREEEIVIADGSISAKEVQDEVQAQEGSDVTVEEFKPSKAEAEQIKQEANSKPEGKAKTDATKATPADPASKDKKQKKPNALKRFFKKILD